MIHSTLSNYPGMGITRAHIVQSQEEANCHLIPLIRQLSDKDRSYTNRQLDALFRLMQKHYYCCWARRPAAPGEIAVVNQISGIEIRYLPPKGKGVEFSDELKGMLIADLQTHLAVLQNWYPFR